jgi:tRNA (uracil-5-)-methyltransferase TRM9
MKTATIAKVSQINRRFYSAFAASFDRTRERPWLGWETVLPRIPRNRPATVLLDVGCGNGRFVRFLEDRFGQPIAYWGLDQSAELLQLAAQIACRSVSPTWVEADVLTDGWTRRMPSGGFDAVVAFGVFHHIAGFDHRHRLIKELAVRVAPGGILAVSFWQFLASPRIRNLCLPWEAFPGPLGPDPADLEEGDCLLSWQNVGLRYCHHSSDDEIRRLVASSQLRLTETYLEDHANRYLILER